MSYTAAGWHDFGGALAALAGALTGLLFVALSIKADLLARSRNLASRAAQTLVLFTTSIIVAIVLVPPQPRLALGVELLVAAAISGVTMVYFDRRAGKSGADSLVAKYLERVSPNLLTALLVAIAGATFLLKAGGGLYWLIPAALASLVGGVINAWLYLIKVTA